MGNAEGVSRLATLSGRPVPAARFRRKSSARIALPAAPAEQSSFGRFHEFGNRSGPGTRQDLDAPAIGELDGAQRHDLETGIDSLADPLGTAWPRGRVDPWTGLNRSDRPLASSRGAGLLPALLALAHGLAGRGLQGRLFLLNRGRDLLGPLLRLSLVCLLRPGSRIDVSWRHRRLRRRRLRHTRCRGRRGAWGGSPSLGRRIDPWPRRLCMASRCGGK